MENISSLKEKWLKNEIEKLSSKGLSKVDISNALDVKPQYLNSILNGSKGITDSFLDKFIAAFKINHFDLLRNTILSNNNPTIFLERIEYQAETIGSLKKEVEQLRDKIQRLENDVSSKEEDVKNASTKKRSSIDNTGATSAGVLLE